MAFIKKKKKNIPTYLSNFFGVVTLNTHTFLFGPTKHAKHFEKMAELTYAILNQGREPTHLPHTHKFRSLKNVVISALHKIDKRIHIQAWMQLSKEEYVRKRIHNGCLVQTESPITQDNCSASLSKPRDAEQLPSWQNFQSQPLKILIIKKMCNVRTYVTHENETFFVLTYVTYKNVIWPNLCYTQKYDF